MLSGIAPIPILSASRSSTSEGLGQSLSEPLNYELAKKNKELSDFDHSLSNNCDETEESSNSKENEQISSFSTSPANPKRKCQSKQNPNDRFSQINILNEGISAANNHHNSPVLLECDVEIQEEICDSGVEKQPRVSVT